MGTQNDFGAIRHRDWIRMEARWRMAEAFYLGGVALLEPDFSVGKIRFAIPNATTSQDGGTSSQSVRQASEFQWRTTESRSFLWKHEGETLEDYNDRARRLFDFPLFQACINIFTGGVLRNGPSRANVTAPWEAFHTDVDLNGTSIDAFSRIALGYALCYGRYHAITDRPSSANGDAVSRAEELDRGERGYACLFSPLDLVDWCLDDKNQFVWIVRREDAPEDRAPGDPQDKVEDQYRVWTRDEWILFRQEKSQATSKSNPGGWVPVERGTHGLAGIQRVPVATLWTTRDVHRMCCESPLANILDINRDILNKLSELDETERTQTFAILFAPAREGQNPGIIDLSPARYMTFNAEDGNPLYVSPDADLPSGKWQRIQDKLWLARQQAGVGRGKAEYSKEERSAEAITVESEDKRNQMASWAGALEEFDNEVHRMISIWDGGSGLRDSYPIANYRKDFDLKGVNVQINELTQLRSVKTVDEQTMVKLSRPIVEKIATEQGYSPTEIGKLLSAFDAATKPPDEDVTKTSTLLQTVGGIQALVALMDSSQKGSMKAESVRAVLEEVLGMDPKASQRIAPDGGAKPLPEVRPAVAPPPSPIASSRDGKPGTESSVLSSENPS